MNSADLKNRTKEFAVRIVGLVERMDKSRTADVIGKQLIRPATSVAANYRAVCRSRFKADFVNKLGIVEEEAGESAFWLEMLVECGKARKERISFFLDEANQVTRIAAASRITARRSLRYHNRGMANGRASSQSAIDS